MQKELPRKSTVDFHGFFFNHFHLSMSQFGIYQYDVGAKTES